MSDLFKWIVTSSVDPTKVSLFIKAGASFLIGIAALFGFAPQSIVDLQEPVITVVVALWTVVSGAFTIYGLLRKAAAGRWSHPDV